MCGKDCRNPFDQSNAITSSASSGSESESLPWSFAASAAAAAAAPPEPALALLAAEVVLRPTPIAEFAFWYLGSVRAKRGER